jgi:hypothetical protein
VSEYVDGVVLICRGVLTDEVSFGARGIDAGFAQLGLVGLALKVLGDEIDSILGGDPICAGNERGVALSAERMQRLA